MVTSTLTPAYPSTEGRPHHPIPTHLPVGEPSHEEEGEDVERHQVDDEHIPTPRRHLQKQHTKKSSAGKYNVS